MEALETKAAESITDGQKKWTVHINTESLYL